MLHIHDDVVWPDYSVFLAQVHNYVEPVAATLPPPAPRTTLAYFGMTDLLKTKITALMPETGGSWTLRAGFNPPDLDTPVAAYIADDDVDNYDLDKVVAFFREWGFEPTLMELEFPQAAAPTAPTVPAPAVQP